MNPANAVPEKLRAEDVKRVLYVDDMRELREVARMALARVGHHVDCAPDGTVALEIVKGDLNAYDIIISDHHMEIMNGLELVMNLREIKFPGKIAIVSSELNEDVETEYRRLGVNKIIYKPVQLEDLRTLVSQS